VALVTCADLPALSPDDKPLIGALAERGIEAIPAIWNDAEIDWAAFDLAVVRSTWDYAQRRPEFVDWAKSVPRLANPAEVVEWNTDKSYLRALEAAGVPVIPTVWLDPARHFSKRAVHTRMPAHGDFVVKPVVASRVKDAGRYQPVDVQSRIKAIQHVMRLLDSQRWVMLQPYVSSVDKAGEISLVYVNGEFQHAASKGTLLTGPAPTVGLGLYRPLEEVRPVEPTLAQREVAGRALDVVTAELGLTESLLYARVDLVTGKDGPLVIELELTEPSLWFAYSGGVPTLANFANAIATRVGIPGSRSSNATFR